MEESSCGLLYTFDVDYALHMSAAQKEGYVMSIHIGIGRRICASVVVVDELIIARRRPCMWLQLTCCADARTRKRLDLLQKAVYSRSLDEYGISQMTLIR